MYLDIEFRKVDKVFGVIANIRLIVFSKQNWLVKEKKPNLAKNKLRKINTFYLIENPQHQLAPLKKLRSV
tara:strand:+ start:325 stop:534 length:210 start_codon:yes stop_codon:yes gene_type:complete